MKNTKPFVPMRDMVHYGGAVIDTRETAAILKVIKDGGGYNWTVGACGARLEAMLAGYAAHRHAILTNSGSSALLLALVALELPRDSFVIIPATTFPTAYSAIIYAGLKPLVVDVKPTTYNIDENQVATALTKYGSRVSAVIAVAIAGNIPHMDSLRRMTAKHGARLIMDNCDGFGGKYKGKPLESWADIAATSFHAAHIITMGEGGAVFTSNADIARRVRQYRDWGREDGDDEPTALAGLPADYPRRYSYPVLGFNLKPLELQAAMGIVQFKKLTRFKAIRAANFKKLHAIFSRHPSLFKTIGIEKEADPCWFSFPVQVLGVPRAVFTDYLMQRRIETRPIFSGNVLRHPIGASAVAPVPCAEADRILERSLFIGVSPRLTAPMIAFIKSVVDDFARAYAA